MPLLYFWRNDNYKTDLDFGAGYHLNQSTPRLHEVEINDIVWAFTRNTQKHYVLAAKLIIHAKTFNPSTFRYGKYRVWGNLSQSKYFLTENQLSIEQIIRSLSIKPTVFPLGRAFQGHAAVRKITRQDSQMLEMASQNLPIDPRARILPEEQLEAAY